MTVLTNHSAIKAVLDTPNPTGKHACWWTRVYGRRVEEVHIVYRARRENASADALSQCPQQPGPLHDIAQDETQVAALNTDTDIIELMQEGPIPSEVEERENYGAEQGKDPNLKEMIDLLQNGLLPEDPDKARKVSAQECLFALMDGVLYFTDARHSNCRRVVVPSHLQEQLLRESHHGISSSHFSGNQHYNTLVKHWWWPGMYADAIAFCKKCPECAIVTGAG